MIKIVGPKKTDRANEENKNSVDPKNPKSNPAYHRLTKDLSQIDIPKNAVMNFPNKDDITNFTNRSPYPTLHLLREASIEQAVAAFPDAASIFERNIETMRKLGPAGWRGTGCGARGSPDGARWNHECRGP